MTAPVLPDAAGEDDECGCCEINDYDGEALSETDTACENCGHSPEEHGL